MIAYFNDFQANGFKLIMQSWFRLGAFRLMTNFHAKLIIHTSLLKWLVPSLVHWEETKILKQCFG